MSARLRRWLPSPVLTIVLAACWPVLNQSWSLGHLLLGLGLGLVIPWWTEPLRQRASMGKPWVLLRLGLVVLKDIVTSNIEVAKLILGKESAIRPAFVWYPLAITDAYGIVALAGIVTMTPGTLSSQLSDDKKFLLIHALNVDDEAALIAAIHKRYERPLMEIFQ